MATEATFNGTASSADGLSAAERLMRKHAADESHKATVEEVVDEEVLAHPPPSGIPAALSNNTTATTEVPPGSVAAGKQPVRETTTKPALDTQSEELFPALGAPKAKTAAAPSMWSKKPSTVGKGTNGFPNGTNGHAVSRGASEFSPSSSGFATPSSTAPSVRGPAPQMSLPGRYSEQIQLHPNDMIPRQQLKRPVNDLLRDINKRSKANVEMKSGAGGVIIFEGTGPVDAVRVALKEVANQLCKKVC